MNDDTDRIDLDPQFRWIWREQFGKYFNTNWWSHKMFVLWWILIPGTVVEVKWPTTAPYDPNDSYRPWLEEHVGKQGWEWEWRIGSFENNSLFIKIRKDKEEHASIIALMWK